MAHSQTKLVCKYCKKPFLARQDTAKKRKFCSHKCSALSWRESELNLLTKQLVGKTFGKLTVLSVGEKQKDGQRLWLCHCTCGQEKFITTAALTLRRAESCGCTGKSGSKNCKWTGFGEISGGYWSSLKACAKTRDIPFDLNIKNAWDLFLKQDRKCALSGVDICFGNVGLPYGKRHSTVSASLDRIDSRKSYSLSNVHWCHKIVNLMKRDLPIDLFIRWCSAVSAHQGALCKA